MANHKSAKTRINRNNKRNIINGARRSRVRTFVKKVEAAILENNKELALANLTANVEAATAAFKVAESELMSAARKNIIPMNRAARTVSRLSHKIKAL